jgi:thioesterase domain-containing protein
LELEDYLHSHIPLSRAMRVSVVSVDHHRVVLAAPLAPNINHRETVFGGSASAVAILSAWSLVYLGLQQAGLSARVVIQRNTMEYTRPITGTFNATAQLANPADWERFLAMLQRKGIARVTVNSVLEQDGQPVGSFTGEFVALGAVK